MNYTARQNSESKLLPQEPATVPVPNSNNTNPEVYNLWTEDLSILLLWWN
jgi:hypothetical protein